MHPTGQPIHHTRGKNGVTLAHERFSTMLITVGPGKWQRTNLVLTVNYIRRVKRRKGNRCPMSYNGQTKLKMRDGEDPFGTLG